MECCCYPVNVQDFLADREIPYERRFGEPFTGRVIPFGAMVEHHPISAKDQSRPHQFGKEILPEIFIGYLLIAKRIRIGDILVADIEELKNMDASEIHPRRINAKEVLSSQRSEYFIFPIADGTAKWSGKDHDFRQPTQRLEQTVRSEDFSRELQGEPEGFSTDRIKR